MSLRQKNLVAGRRRRRILGSRSHAVDHVEDAFGGLPMSQGAWQA